MKTMYEKPDLEVSDLAREDVLTTSQVISNTENHDHRDNPVDISGGGFVARGFSLVPPAYK